MGVTMNLAALCLGYLVFIQGSREKEGTRSLGRIIGIVVMLVAAACFAGSIMRCSLKGGCPMTKKMMCSMKGAAKAAKP